jgi:putative spermidine/putrescine transport system permease protein
MAVTDTRDATGGRRAERWRLDPLPLLAVPAAGYLVVAFALPLAGLLVTSVLTPEGPSLAGYVRFFADAYGWRVLRNSVEAALLTTALCFVIGYPTACALARARGALQIVLLIALILPLSVGVVVKAFSWTILLRSNGVVNQALMLLGLTDEPVRFIFTQTGLVLGAVNVFLSFMVLPIYAVIRLIDPRLLDAAATLGAGPVHRFLRVTLPLTMPGVVAGVAFVFSMSVSMYVIPTLLIGDRYQTLSTLIARSYLFMRDRSLGSTVSVVLLVIAVIVVVASGRLARPPGRA